MANDYRRNSLARALVSLVPAIGGAADAAIGAMLDQADEAHRQAVISALRDERLTLTPEILANHDFLRSWCLVNEAMSRTVRTEKAVYFAKLWANFVRDGHFAEQLDSFEEFLGVLDDLKPREIAALVLLRNLESQHPFGEVENDNELRRAWRYWETFIDRMAVEIGVPADQLTGFLARLQRTGLYRTMTGGYVGYEGDMGSVTPYFDALLQALGMAGEEPAE
jgi:hypothetical protein